MAVASKPRFSRLPRHVGLIPDGNRRWARERGMHPGEGYGAGLEKGLVMLDECIDLGIDEVSVYGFTMDNTKRPSDQREAFSAACVGFVEEAMNRDVALKVVGDWTSKVFPEPLKPYAIARQGEGRLKVNVLVNYGWNWDLQTAVCAQANGGAGRPFVENLASADVSRIDLVVRWGGMRRLSGFLPVQSVYADFFVVDAYWPEYEAEQFYEALRWYAKQDVTLGG
jgi:undecaprenyl diphosphate synthase